LKSVYHRTSAPLRSLLESSPQTPISRMRENTAWNRALPLLAGLQFQCRFDSQPELRCVCSSHLQRYTAAVWPAPLPTLPSMVPLDSLLWKVSLTIMSTGNDIAVYGVVEDVGIPYTYNVSLDGDLALVSALVPTNFTSSGVLIPSALLVSIHCVSNVYCLLMPAYVPSSISLVT
jgi:hypothetical protein